MVIDVLSAPATVQPPDRPRRRGVQILVVAVALVLLAALVTGVTILRAAPNLGEGSFYQENPTVIEATDGYQSTRHVIDGNAGGRLLTSVRNDGSVSVTLLGLDIAPGTPSVLAQIWFEPDPFGPNKVVGKYTPLVSQVTLKPGQEAGVVLDVRTPACLPQQKGSAEGFDAIPVRARRLGIDHSATIPLDLPLWVNYAADHPSSGTCS